MKDQMETKVLTNSFTFSHSPVLLMGAIIAFALVCSFYITGFGFIGVLTALSVIGYLAWTQGHISGAMSAVESTLEYLVEDGFLEREVLEDDVEVCRIDNLVYLDKCKCGERLIINRSATKGHEENGKEQDDE